MTEDEAKTKWCPFVRQPQAVPRLEGIDIAGACNADAEGQRFARQNCIGSACMAWRWSDHGGLARVHPDVLKPPVAAWKDWEVSNSEPDERGYVEITKPRQDGFCGLAGAPQ